MEWKAQSVRFSAFAPAQLVARGAFRGLTGNDPETASEKPRDGFWTEVGTHAGRRITITCLPGRAQLELQATDAEEFPFAVFASAYNPVMQESLAIGQKWLESLSSPEQIVRLAFGAVLLCDCANRTAAYTALQPLLPALNIDVNASADLLYRINRPRTSKALPSVILNRLCTWQAVEIQQLVISSSNNRLTPGFATLATAARLELDVNTDAHRTEPLIAKTLGSVLSELVAQGVEIMADGDRP